MDITDMQNKEVKTWSNFYKGRVNNPVYEKYFHERYKLFTDNMFRELYAPFPFDIPTVREEGCGICGVYKSLSNYYHYPNLCFNYIGIDTHNMIELAKTNLEKVDLASVQLYVDDICHPLKTMPKADLVITHGVLEHFSDWMIGNILNRYKEKGERSIHYVPLDKYETPSFGDERLLPVQYWLDLVKPVEATIFNNGYDLMFIV